MNSKSCHPQARSYEHVPAPAVAKYSFGQPRVGNMPFATDYGVCGLAVLCSAKWARCLLTRMRQPNRHALEIYRSRIARSVQYLHQTVAFS